ncbi:MAG: trypsin-like peptidase domain-containing protein [Oscillospiraceae bacterium]|nr:trypsin-like peptidase domain-containing protein [Oscillospiraceae bacterium]
MNYGQNDAFRPYNGGGRPGKGRSAASLIVIVIITSIIAGCAGGGAVYYVLKDSIAGYAYDGAAVINEGQTSQPGGTENAAEYQAYAEKVAASCSESVVEVTTEFKVTHPFFGSYIQSGAGSGVIISSDGYIVTNNHVISGSTSIQVRTSDGTDYTASLVGADSATDLAVLKIEAANLKAVAFSDSSEAKTGQPVVAIGNPLGTLGGTVTEGIISSKDREISIDGDVMTLLQTSAAINPGNSGGALFDSGGYLIGVVNAKSTGNDIEGIGFAIPSNTVKKVVPELIEHGYVTGRPGLGAQLVTVSNMSSAYQYRRSEYGVYVYSIMNRNGLEAWDMLVSMDGREIISEAEVKRIINEHEVGDVLEITVKRGGVKTTLEVELAEKTRLQSSGDIY